MASPPSSSARVANLLRLVHAVAHDLSNPLQALVLHATMDLEDAPPGSEEAVRRESDEEATRCMRALVHALMGLSSAGLAPRPLSAVFGRFEALLHRRFAGRGITLSFDLPEGDGVAVASTTEEVLLLAGLALVERLPPAREARELRLGAHVDPASGACSLRLRLFGGAPAPTWAEITPEVERDGGTIAPGLVVIGDGPVLRLELPGPHGASD